MPVYVENTRALPRIDGRGILASFRKSLRPLRALEFGMAYVTPREGETPESLVNRFRASVQHAGILRELKDRRFFRSKAQKERLAAQRAARRRRRQRR